ncbi:MAG TPA: glycosyltransferase [Candidatus Moranbacteria bacterium]|nr:glycosyltransferase [Candidatus Moranbacteria bacterium]
MQIAFIGKRKDGSWRGELSSGALELARRMAAAGHSVFLYADGIQSDPRQGIITVSTPKTVAKIFGKQGYAVWAAGHCLMRPYDAAHFTEDLPLKARILVRTLRFFKKRTAVVEERVGFAVEAHLTSNAKVLSEANLKSKRYFLAKSHLGKESGLHQLVEAFKRLEDTAKVPNAFKLVIVAQGETDDDYARYLEMICHGRENILLVCLADEAALGQLLMHAYLFVHPSTSAKDDISLRQAMSYGLATLASGKHDRSAGRIGFVFKEGVAELGDKLAYLLARPDEVAKAAALSYEHARVRYGWETLMEKTLKRYAHQTK